MNAIQREDAQTQPSPPVIKKPGRILAVDYGRKRIGLAVSDDLQTIAQPLAVLSRRNRQEDMRRLRDVCRRQEVRKIIVGRPVYLNGAESEMGTETARFADRL